MERYKTTNDIINASHEDLIDYALEVTAERNALKAENAELHKSDASKEQSSIDYYCKFRKLKDENKELKARLEKAVELPCKVGDTVYRICPKDNDRMQIALDEGKRACGECAWGACMWGASGEGCTVFGLWDDGNYPAEKCIIVPEKVRWGTFPKIARELNKKIFLTREAAEARLKELRGEE